MSAVWHLLPSVIAPDAPTWRLPFITPHSDPETLRRMAISAERDGVRILLDQRMEQHVAIETGADAFCYLLDAETGCTCRVYRAWARCPHHALLLAQLGRIPDEPGIVILSEIGAFDSWEESK